MILSAQQRIDKKYKSEEKKTLPELKIDSYVLEGELKITDFVQLTKLDCRHNQLTKLDISNCSQLTEILCSGNKSLELNLSNLPTSLKKIYCDGKLAEQLKGYVKIDEKGREYYDYQA